MGGFVVLDIDWTFKRDSGKYTCRAENKNGSAETTATLTCKSRKDVNVDSQLPQGMSLEKLKELENRQQGSNLEDEAEITAPKFITQIESRAVGEGEPVHFNCRVEPKHDPKLQVTGSGSPTSLAMWPWTSFTLTPRTRASMSAR